jgi:hypothetical protein
MKPSTIICTSIIGLMLTATHLTAGSPPGGAGFNAVDGVSSELTIAVGDHGTIVHFLEGKNARRMPSPTERDLFIRRARGVQRFRRHRGRGHRIVMGRYSLATHSPEHQAESILPRVGITRPGIGIVRRFQWQISPALPLVATHTAAAILPDLP